MLRILWGIVFCGLSAWASEYLFSYRVVIKNGIVLNEKYNFSPAMVSAKMLDKVRNPYKKCEIPHGTKSEREFLAYYKEEILECFFNWGVRLEDRSEVQNLQGKSLTLLAIPPSRIKIEYENGIATIYALIKKE
ncbi:hypothetical protein [Helicobacter winghamensis]|uniref:hypothetical protein n=1 Tax=Helicobacter winghamensis TaxID=157268 RepID=UPI0001A281C6|nr:hypothetical protein [Helicobacter winghamensis]EEO25981.1 hypothetical protein HWAG_00773 [Helicobacter winghamensis ATCC BAA-430]PKT76992.1 hypothetical protein BCM34_07400 [Helicobacter winghamensis]PKT77132.1 hypothetical protein BCM35_03485 [Helicobacter winghamensis]QOQ98493.1 hypothetical protein A0Z60_02665 [Helicobacter winghamensis]